MSHTDHRHTSHTPSRKLTWVFWGFAAIAVFFLLGEHRAHALGWLPFLIILACPLMHIFGHHGHGHGNTDDRPKSGDSADPAGDTFRTGERSLRNKGDDHA